MDCDDEDNSGVAPNDSRCAVNSLILDYYKKIGRKRDLEQYFSLSTAHSEIRDPTSGFWRKLKDNDSSDSGERSDKKSESPQELCRISIRCTLPDPSSTSQDEDVKTKTESDSPPIIIEEISNESGHNTDNESIKSDDNNSQKSLDILLDTSMNKPLSPSSSITSQRKLEWDSLADVGYGNESDRKTSASSLSTLERLALKQQYSNNDSKENNNLGIPTAHSTPVDDDGKGKSKKGVGKKSTKIINKGVDFLELNVPHSSNINPAQSINVNLTKHISFNVEKDGKITLDAIQKDVSISPEKSSVDKDTSPNIRMDKEIQTSLLRNQNAPHITENVTQTTQPQPQKIPILISLNTLRRRTRRKKVRVTKRKLKLKRKADKENIPIQEKSGEQLSDAESFEYMPGHMYNQNQMDVSERSNAAGNKSSLESSRVNTTESSKGSKHSFTKDLEKSIDLLRAALKEKCTDPDMRNQLIKQVCQRLIKSRYRDDDSTTDFLSGLSFSSRKLGLGEGNTTTSTSDAGNNSTEKSKRPKKSILRLDKFNVGDLACTSQSAPNLPVVTDSDKLVSSNLIKMVTTSNTESDISSKEKSSSDNIFAKTSSEQLYKKYLEAVKREEAYKRHLKDKEIFLKQKLVSSENVTKVLAKVKLDSMQKNDKLKDLMYDLTRNNYNDGSGDASRIESAPASCRDDSTRVVPRTQRSHSVFTLCCGNSDKKPNKKKNGESVTNENSIPSTSTGHHYCCCPHHADNLNLAYTDSSVQANLLPICSDDTCPNKSQKISNNSPRKYQHVEPARSIARVVSDDNTGEVKYVCLSNKDKPVQENPESFLIYKCSLLNNKAVQLDSIDTSETCTQCERRQANNKHDSHESHSKSNPNKESHSPRKRAFDYNNEIKKSTKSSQTNIRVKMLQHESSEKSSTSSGSKKSQQDTENRARSEKNWIYEVTRCIQTEISINPQIIEPSLSDINIVPDVECVKIISENCRYLSKQTSSISNPPSNKGSGTSNSSSTKSTGTSKGVYQDYDFQEENNALKNLEKNAHELETQCTATENFSLPIQGTNMTLIVSIESEEHNNQKPETKVSQATGTDKVPVSEQATSLLEECSKGVQAEETNPDPVPKVDSIENKPESKNHNDFKTLYFLNSCLTEDPKCGTFPKNVRKPFLRSNTDTERIDKVCAQTEGNRNFKAAQGDYPLDPQPSTARTAQNINWSHRDESRKDKEIEKTPIAKSPDTLRKPFENKTCVGCKDPKEDPIAPKQTDKEHSRKSSIDANQNFVSCQTDASPDYLGKTAKLGISEIAETPSLVKETQQQETSNSKPDDHKESYKPIPDPTKDSINKEYRTSERVKKENSFICQKNDTKAISQVGTESSQQQPSMIKDNLGICPECSEKKSIETGQPSERRQPSLSNKEIGIQSEDRYHIKEQKGLRGSETTTTSKESTNERNPDKEMHKKYSKPVKDVKISTASDKPSNVVNETDQAESGSEILNVIQDLTRRYSKKDIDKTKRKKCFREIMSVLKYLLETEDGSDKHIKKGTTVCDTLTEDSDSAGKQTPRTTTSVKSTKKHVDKGIQSHCVIPKTRTYMTSSSDAPASTEVPSTSTETTACKVLNRIRKECEKYHQKRCKTHSGKKCDVSTTSVNCEDCKQVHHCSCRGHKCKGHKKKCEKTQKKPVAYNLILQSESLMSETSMCCDKERELKNVIVKVPKRKPTENVPFCEMAARFEKKMEPRGSKEVKPCRSRSLPNESDILSMAEIMRKSQGATVREYLEKNRPDFIQKCDQRQTCLKYVSETRANVRAAHRAVLSRHVAQLSDVTALGDEQLCRLATDLGRHLRHKQTAPKFISEREMKKHSEKIYKSLPEVIQKKEEIRKENIKKTNLLMVNLFKKNLQKKTLRGSVNLSNYSPVIKI